MTKLYGLSKSRITAFLQCPKRLWLEVHRPALSVQSPGTEAAFAVGHQVGNLARAEYPEGVLIPYDKNPRVALEATDRQFNPASFRTPDRWRGLLLISRRR